MFNLSGSELIFLVIIALVVLGPDKLPEAMRKAGKAYADFKKMTTGFQTEMKSVLDEPMRELRETAELAKNSAMFDTKPFTDSLKDLGNTVTKPATKAATKQVSGSMADLTPKPAVAAATPVVAVPTEKLPAETVPAQDEPAETVPAQTAPANSTVALWPVEPLMVAGAAGSTPGDHGEVAS